MDEKKEADRKNKIILGIYSSSWGMSMTALTVVSALEIFMLIYTLIDPALFGVYMSIYRTFYVALLSVALAYICLNFYVKKDMEHRYKLLSIANPICATFFFAWSLGITYFDAVKFSVIDPAVFMTFSLTVPLSFYLFPAVYAVIAIAADGLMLYMTAVISGTPAPLINLSIFFIFQFVLGISFLRLKMKLAERIVEEQENALIDVLTGLPNRRAYAAKLDQLTKEPLRDDLIYAAIDINGLKEVNDNYGHEAGDKLIVGAARSIEKCFGDKGKIYRIGGDEFVVLIHTEPEEMEKLLQSFEENMKDWSGRNDLELSAAYGYVSSSECNIADLARVADQRMYDAKARFYQENNRDRRHNRK